MALGTPYTVVSGSATLVSGTTFQATISHDVAAGDALALFGADNQTSITAVTDSAGDTWVQQTNQNGNAMHSQGWYKLNSSPMSNGSDWIKITFGNITSSSEVALIVRGCSGVATVAAIDSAATLTAFGTSGAPAVTGGTTLAQASEWIVLGLMGSNATGGPSAFGGGFTQRAQEHQTGQPYVTVADQVVAATTAVNGSATQTSGVYSMIQMAFKAAVTGASLPLFGMDAQPALATWQDMEAKIGIPAIKGERMYNGAGLPAAFPGADTTFPGVTRRIVSFKPTLPLSAADQTTIGTLASQMATDDWFCLWHEGEKSGYTPSVLKTALSTAQTIVHANAPGGWTGKFVQIVMSYTAYTGSSHYPLNQWIQSGLDAYGIDLYPSTPADASVSTSADRALAAIQAVAGSGAAIAICETNYTTDNVSGITWSQSQALWFTQAWAWAKAHSCLAFFCYFYNAHNVPWPPDAATIAVLNSIANESGSTLAVSTATLPAGEVNIAYSQTLTATGGTPSYTWSLVDGALPDGLALSSGGVISGTPVTPGTFSFTVQVLDSASVPATKVLSITIGDTLAVATTTLPGGSVSSSYAATLTASGGSGPLTWSIASGSLPTGLALNASSGQITGVPTGSGTSSFTVQVNDAFASAQKALSITITGAVLSIATGSLPSGTVQAAYTATLAAVAGTAPYTWAVTGGALPPGLTLSSGGVLSGTPTQSGNYQVTITVTDNVAATASATFSIVVVESLESLVISGHIELLQGGVTSLIPECAGASFILQPGYDLSAPQNTVAATAAVYLDGERPVGRRASNRTIALPIKVIAPDRQTLAAAREVLLEAVDHDWWELTWSRPGGPPMVFDCFRAEPTVMQYALEVEQQLISQLVVQFEALPYGRSDAPIIADFPSALPDATPPPVAVTLDNFSSVGWQWTNAGTSDNKHAIVTDVQGQGVAAGERFQIYTSGLVLKESTIFTVTSVSAAAFGFRNLPFTPNAAASLASGDIIKQVDWTQSPIGPGPNSAFWRTGTTGAGKTAVFSKSGLNVSIVGQQAIAVWVGLGSTAFFKYSGLKQKMLAKFTITLSDGTNQISAHLTRRVKMSNNSYDPVFQRVRIPIPQGQLFNYSAVTCYAFSVSTKVAGDAPYTDVYLDSLQAVPHVTQGPVGPNGGQVYDLAGTIGSARSLMSIQCTQPAGTVNTVTKRFSTVGTHNWLAPADVSALAVETYGPGGRGGQPTSVLAAGGGGGGGYMGEAKKVTPRQVYPIVVPDGGNSGTGTAGSATFVADDGTVSAGGGSNVGNSATGGAGGAGASLRQQATGQESNFDGGIGNWTGTGNATPTPDAVVFDTGTGSMKLTSIASGDMSAGSCSQANYATQGHPCSSLLPVNVAGRVRAAASARQASVGAEFFDAAGNNLGALYGADTLETVGSFITVTPAVLNPPAGAVWYREKGRIKATGAANEVHNFDNITSTSGATSTGGTGGAGAGGPNGGGGGGAAGRTGNGLNGTAGSGTGNGGGAGPGGTDAGAGGAGCKGPFNAAKPGMQAGGGGGGGVQNTASGVGGKGAKAEVVLTYQTRAAFKTLVIHRPRPDAPDTLTPFVALGTTDTPDGNTEYLVDTLVTGENARFDSTYTVVLVSEAWHNPSAARDLTVRVRQYEQAGGTVYTKSVTRLNVVPNDLDSPLVNLGEITLPDHAMPVDNTGALFAITVTSEDTADRFQDVLFLDCAGSTIMIESPNAYVSYWVDEPAIGREIGNIMASNFDRGDAVSVMAWAKISGPPLWLDPIAANQQLLVYAAEGPPAAQVTYFSRWMLDRVV